jgi:hypothetical protein
VLHSQVCLEMLPRKRQQNRNFLLNFLYFLLKLEQNPLPINFLLALPETLEYCRFPTDSQYLKIIHIFLHQSFISKQPDVSFHDFKDHYNIHFVSG